MQPFLKRVLLLSAGVMSLSTSWGAGIELHSHLFMKQGMGWLFQGDFNEPLQAKNWKDRFSSQANPSSLDRSNLDLVVATLYAHPLFKLSLRDSIREQIKLARQFIKDHPKWILFMSHAFLLYSFDLLF